MASVVLRNLVKTYRSVAKDSTVNAVKGINLEIRDGEFMVLVGPSGCGKSTTLRMIAGLEEISAGTIAIDGVAVNNLMPKDRGIAMVFQNYALYPHMTVFENMAFGLTLAKIPKPEIQDRVKDAARILGLETLLDRKPAALSGGQRQRVAVGRAIVRKPKVFLFDEPLSNLDAKMRVTMRTEISKLHARLAATMIYVTHDQIEAMTMGDRICVMKDGSIMQVATPLELYNNPANMFVAGFIGSPPMNFFRGTLARDGNDTFFVEDNDRRPSLRLLLDDSLAREAAAHLNRSIILGIRPEHVHDAATLRSPQPQRTAEVVVEISEPMGAETFLYLDTGAHAFVARVHPSGHFEPNQMVRVTFDLAHARMFDAVTEKALPFSPLAQRIA